MNILVVTRIHPYFLLSVNLCQYVFFLEILIPNITLVVSKSSNQNILLIFSWCLILFCYYYPLLTCHLHVCFMYTHLSHSFILNPLDNIILLNFWYHYLGACFKPYNDLTSLQNFYLWLGKMNPSSCSTKILSSNSLFLKCYFYIHLINLKITNAVVTIN